MERNENNKTSETFSESFEKKKKNYLIEFFELLNEAFFVSTIQFIYHSQETSNSQNREKKE